MIDKEISPITGQSGTILLEIISVKTIIELYKNMQMDVVRFFENMDTIELRECKLTGYRYYFPFSIFGDDKFYEDLQAASSLYYPENKWEHLKAIAHINERDSVLEIGCATGFFLGKINSIKANGIGLELNNKALQEAKKKGFEVYNELINDFSNKNVSTFDVVCSFQVLEHINDVKDYFESMLMCLKPGGKMIIGVPNNNPYIHKYDFLHTLNLPPHHAGLWNKETFENVANYYNLDIESIQISPLTNYKHWYLIQAENLKKKNIFLGKLMLLIPRPIYKIILKIFSNFIEGNVILCVFKKK